MSESCGHARCHPWPVCQFSRPVPPAAEPADRERRQVTNGSAMVRAWIKADPCPYCTPEAQAVCGGCIPAPAPLPASAPHGEDT